MLLSSLSALWSALWLPQSPWEWGIVAVAFLWAAWAALTWNHAHFRRRGMPFVKPLPLLGSMAPVTFSSVAFPDFIVELYERYRDVPMFGFFQFRTPVLLIRDPELIRLVAIKDFDHFVDHRPLASEKIDPIMGRNLFSLRGQEWREMRATLSPAFTSSKMKAIFKLIDGCGAQAVNYIEKQIAKSPDKMFTSEMKDFFTRFTNDVIATSAFGIQVDSLNKPANDFYAMGRELTNMKGFKMLIMLGYMMSPKLMEILNQPFVSPPVRKFFTNIVMTTIRERQKNNIFRPDMLQLMMQTRQGGLEVAAEDAHEAEKIRAEKKQLTDEDILAQAVIFFFGGFDTVATAMCFSAMLLARHPDVQRRLQKEIDEMLLERDGAITYEAVMGMKYLDMVINETLRLYTPGTFMDRVCVKDYTFPAKGGLPAYTVRKGESVWFPVHALQHDPQYWSDPEKFDPERFNDKNKSDIKPFTYIPFGVGPRVCIGNRFALMEVKVVLIHLLSRFSLVTTPKTPKEMRCAKNSLTITLEGGFWLGFKHRDL